MFYEECRRRTPIDTINISVVTLELDTIKENLHDLGHLYLKHGTNLPEFFSSYWFERIFKSLIPVYLGERSSVHLYQCAHVCMLLFADVLKFVQLFINCCHFIFSTQFYILCFYFKAHNFIFLRQIFYYGYY